MDSDHRTNADGQIHADLAAIGGWWWNDGEQIRRADAVFATLKDVEPEPPAQPAPGADGF